MNDQELRELLDSLPPITSRPSFTQRVVDALEESQSSGPPSALTARYRFRWLVAAGLFCLMLSGGVWKAVDFQRETATQLHQAEMDALRAESERLSRELTSLRSRAETAPVVYLGGTEDVDYVVDFARFAESRSVRTAGL